MVCTNAALSEDGIVQLIATCLRLGYRSVVEEQGRCFQFAAVPALL